MDFYDARTGKHIVRFGEYLRRKVFYIHGTTSSPDRWRDWKEAVDVLNRIALPYPSCAVDTAFNWKEEAGQFNSLKDRWAVSDRLVEYVKANRQGYTEIVFVGHSHGGNVAIMAADKLTADPTIFEVYVITVGTPVFNKTTFESASAIPGFKEVGFQRVEEAIYRGGMNAGVSTYRRNVYTYYNPENPANWKNRHKIKHLSIYNEYDRVDGIAEAGAPFIEYSRMTSNTSSFEYSPDVNRGLSSRLSENAVTRVKYCSYCLTASLCSDG